MRGYTAVTAVRVRRDLSTLSRRMGGVPRTLAVALVALACTGAAWAALPGMGTVHSVASADGKLIYEVTWKKGRTTVNLDRNARTVESARLKGKFGFATPTNAGIGEGLSHDGRTLVLASVGSLGRFAVLDAKTLHLRRTIRLRGQFTYDALSPNGSTLFLIQHVGRGAVDHYYVRAYDLNRGRLLKQIIFDAREESSVMTGWAVTRATGPSGRWVYTLYGKSNGTLFVHALDTIDRHAVCVDLPRRVAQEAFPQVTLKLASGRLAVRNGTRRIAVIDTKTLRVTR
jgi:hypothetical protein